MVFLQDYIGYLFPFTGMTVQCFHSRTQLHYQQPTFLVFHGRAMNALVMDISL